MKWVKIIQKRNNQSIKLLARQVIDNEQEGSSKQTREESYCGMVGECWQWGIGNVHLAGSCEEGEQVPESVRELHHQPPAA